MPDSTPPPTNPTVTPGGIRPPQSATKTPPRDRLKLPPTTGGDSLRKTAVKELLGVPMLGLSFMAAREQAAQPEAISPYALDVVTLAMHADSLADSVAQMADAYPVLGTLLDRIGTVTPFMALAGVVMAIGTQIAENHGRLPAGMDKASPGLIPREELAKQIRDEAAARRNGDA